MDKEVCHHLWRSCANDSSRKVVPTATIDGVRPRELGRYRKVMSLGDKQEGDQDAKGLAEWSEIGERGHLGLKPPNVH